MTSGASRATLAAEAILRMGHRGCIIVTPV
jgi:hypothetical protein